MRVAILLTLVLTGSCAAYSQERILMNPNKTQRDYMEARVECDGRTTNYSTFADCMTLRGFYEFITHAPWEHATKGAGELEKDRGECFDLGEKQSHDNPDEMQARHDACLRERGWSY